MSNLPVLWVPPVTPPDPDERPPKRRSNKGVLLAAVVILATPFLAVAVFGGSKPAPVKTVEATTQPPVAVASETVAPVVAPPVAAPTAIGPSPDTSGGNQPYIAAPVAAPTPAADADKAAAEAPQAVGADGRPVRVIGLDRRPEDRGETVSRPARPPAAKAEAPAAERLVVVPAPDHVVTVPPPAKPEGSAPAPVRIEAATPRGSIGEPVAPGAARVDPTPDPEPKAAASKATEPKPTPPRVAEPKFPEPKITEPKVAEPKVAEPKAAAPKVASRPVEPDRSKAPLPPRRETAARPEGEMAPPAGADGFADRLAAIRRAEGRRAVEPPPMADDEEVVVPARPRRWGFVPPFFDGAPRGPVLRSFEEPPREASRRDPRADNCHYHAWPTEEMVFHRTVRCHWHQDPDDPSIRYVR